MNAAFPARIDAPARASGPDPRVLRARRAARAWAAVPIRRRVSILREARHRLAERADGLAAAVARPGRTTAETLSAEILPLADAMRFAEREAPVALAPRRPSRRGRPGWLGGVDLEIVREPWGVVLVVGPSNYPLSLAAMQTVQALVAGNAVLVKPGEGGGEALRRFRSLLVEAGVPEGAVQVLGEAPDEASTAIEAGVDRVVLTGSAGTGRVVLGALAGTLTPAAMELSGCDAAFVLPGADLDLVTDALRFGTTLNGGATCIAPRRVFVPADRAAALERRLLAALDGRGRVPVTTPAAARTDALVHDATARGARLVAGEVGTSDMRPIVLADVPADARVLREEAFVPLLAIVPVRDADHALALDRLCPYALGATVFGPEREARAIASHIDAGVVVVNDAVVPTADPRLPFGGRGESGFGTTRGREGLIEMTRPKAVAVRRGRFRPHLEPPVGVEADLFRAWIRTAHGRTWTARLAALPALARALLAAARGARTRRPNA